MKKYTAESIATKYLSGESGYSIAKYYGITSQTVYRILRINGVPRRNGWRFPKIYLPDDVMEDYLSGKPSGKIAKEKGVSPATIIRFLKHKNIPRRSNELAHRKCTLDESVFDEINENSAYWSGFIAADGTISDRRNGSPSIIVTLSSIDVNHIHKLKSFFSTSRRISVQHRKDREYFGISVTSSKIANRLIAIGITPRKTFTLKISSTLASNRHFWRGFMDGDGHITITKRGLPMFQIICASKILLEQFLKFLRDNGIGDHLFVYPRLNYFRIATSGRTAQSICSLLYKDCDVFLDRKKKVADIIIGLNIWHKNYVHQMPTKTKTIR